jgi:hypothetical protein
MKASSMVMQLYFAGFQLYLFYINMYDFAITKFELK